MWEKFVKLQTSFARPYEVLVENRYTHLLFATSIERGIHNRQVLKYQPLVTSRLIFQYSMIINGIK